MKPTVETFDPYRPPELDAASPSPTAPRRAEMTLKIIAIVMVILSLMAAAGGLIGVVTSLAPDYFMPQAAQSGSDELDAAQQLWRDGAVRIQHKYAWALGLSSFVRMLAGLLGCAAGFFILRTPRSLRILLQIACVAFIVAELVCILPDILVKWELLTVANIVAQQMGQSNPNVNLVVEMTFRYSTIGGIVLGIVFMLVKFGFFLYCLQVAQRPAIIALFADETGPPPDDLIPAQLA